MVSEKLRKARNDSTWISPIFSWYINTTAYCASWMWPVLPKQKSAWMFPPGVFLIFEDRAWPAVPQKALGGPCYFGKLTLFAPNIHQLHNISHKSQCSKLSVHHLGPECRNDMQLWNPPSVILASIFAPGVASSKALRS